MTMIVTPRTRSAAPGQHALRRWWMAFKTWRTEQAAIAQLQSMSDRELKDIGLSRPQIGFVVKDGIARHSVYRRF